MATAFGLWLASGVRVDEIARFVPYEVGFVFFPGFAVYRAVVSPPGGRLRQVVLGWSLGYLLEILTFLFTAAAGARFLFYVYPLLVGGPAAVIAWRRRGRAQAAASSSRLALIWIGAALCAVLLGYVAVVAFTQLPLPRDVHVATYQEDTPFVISLAAEALHHWPMTLPMVSGHPLHYHLFAFLHMAAVSQVTGIDLSVVVMRLYEVPLVLLFALQLILLGRRVGRSANAGLVAVFVVLFLGELDVASGTKSTRFLFDDFFFYWLTASHTFLFGFVFFVPAVLLFCDLLGSTGASKRTQWVLLAGFLVGCVGAKSYSVVPIGAALFLLLLWQWWRERRVNRRALGGLILAAAIYAAANVLVLGFSSAGAFLKPFWVIKQTTGVTEVGAYLGHIWGMTHVPTVLGVGVGLFGLLSVPLVGIGLLLAYRGRNLAADEAFLLAMFLTALPPLLLLYQPGLGELFLVFYGVAPGAVLAACGFRLFWLQHGRFDWRPGVVAAVGMLAAVLAFNAWMNAPARVGFMLLLFVIAVAVTLGAATAVYSRATAKRVAIGVGLVGAVLLETPAIKVVRSGSAALATVVALLVLAIVALAIVRRRTFGPAVAVGALVGLLFVSVLDTPLDWFPHLLRRAIDGKPLYAQDNSGLTAGLYAGLTWIRDNTPTNAILVVNNHSLHPDGRDSKYFYYSAFAQRRIVLESWDYTDETVKQRRFSLDYAHSPFPRRLALSDAVFKRGDARALQTLAHDYDATYLVADKVHGPASPKLAQLAGRVFSNDDVDVYAIGTPGVRTRPTTCASEQGAGIGVSFGRASTHARALAIQRSVDAVGFKGSVVQRRGCSDYAVVVTELRNLAQATELKREAARVGITVKIECRTKPALGGLNAVFGHRRTRRAAEQLAARAEAVGFRGLDVQEDACGDWEVDLVGLKTAAQRRDFRNEAARVGFRIRYEPG